MTGADDNCVKMTSGKMTSGKMTSGTTLRFLLNSSAPYQMRVGVWFDLVVLQARDRPINLQHRQRDLVAVVDAVLAQGAMQFIHADVFASHVRFDDRAVVNQQERGSAFRSSLRKRRLPPETSATR